MPEGQGPDIVPAAEVFSGDPGQGPDQTIDLSKIMAKYKPSSTPIDGAADMRRGAMQVQKAAETAQYGSTLPNKEFTVGQLNDLLTKITVAKAANREPPKRVPDAPEPVTIPQVDEQYQQHQQIEQDYLAGNLSYPDYLQKVQAVYGHAKFELAPNPPDVPPKFTTPNATNEGDLVGALQKPDGRVPASEPSTRTVKVAIGPALNPDVNPPESKIMKFLMSRPGDKKSD